QRGIGVYSAGIYFKLARSRAGHLTYQAVMLQILRRAQANDLTLRGLMIPIQSKYCLPVSIILNAIK
ncbi:hypothetical protein, partial [Sansalvadorimonas verongulae]|uniref:hypothetical protein n=1 Tax=Sansalvadorimonas verongulae TaxID=2172824 RepID=UPI001E4E9FEA